MWANLGVVLIVSGCAAYQYLKGTFLKSFAAIVATISASVIAFGYFELLANVFVSRSENSRFDDVVPWLQPLCFVLLFVVAFAVLQTIVTQLLKKPVDLGILPERIGRAVCGVFLGLILSGLLLTALAMAPIPNEYPYQRFDTDRPDADKPGKAFLKPDDFVTGWFSLLSDGTFSSKRSFATLHPAFVDQVFLNRLLAADGLSVITSSQAIEVPPRRQKSVWLAPDGIVDLVGKPVPQKPRHRLTIARVGIKKMGAREGTAFTLSQLRLICKPTRAAKDPFTGKAVNIYPIGYLKTADRLQRKKLNDLITLAPDDFDGAVRYIDFAFYVPTDFQPVLVEFKQNSIARLQPPASSEDAPEPLAFVQLSMCAKDLAELQPIRSAKVYGIQLAAEAKLLDDLTLKIDDPSQWQTAQTQRSIAPARFEDGKITYVRAELRIEKSRDEPEEGRPKSGGRPKRPPKKKSYKRRPKGYVEPRKGIQNMLEPRKGYELLSLKCNNPSTGSVMKAEQLPVLVDLSGSIHHPVGVIASGKVGDLNISEVDYCSLAADRIPDGLVFAKDGSVAKPFPDAVWLTEQARSITEFYVLYLVRTKRNAIITAVQPAGSREAARFKKHEGFLVK